MSLLSKYAFGLIAVHVVLIPLGILAEWPAQFDPSSDPDAGAEWASRGTVVCAPSLRCLGWRSAAAEQTPRTVLVITGIVGTTLALTLMALAAGDRVARFKARRSSGSRLPAISAQLTLVRSGRVPQMVNTLAFRKE